MFERLRRLTRAAGASPPAAEDVDRLVAEADRLRTAGQSEAARTHYRKAHEADPARVYPLYWLATLAEEAGDLEGARRYCELALGHDREQLGLLMRHASICAAQSDDVAALECYETIARLDPEAPVDAHLADQYCRLGRIGEGLAAFDRAIARAPDDAFLEHNRLFVMNFSSERTPAQNFARHREWGERLERRLGAVAAPAVAAASKLVVGYMSPDLRDHAVAHFIEPLLREHDRTRFKVHCFDTSAGPGDAVTQRLMQLPVRWHRVSTLDDDRLADYVRAAGVHVLVDLAGHTKGGRLEVFARRAAPVQVTWLGYLGSSGLQAMDYRLTDDHMDPCGSSEHLHTENLQRLPVHACFEPWRDAPEPTTSPVASGRPLTFGSVNQWPKVSLSARAVWAEILAAEPRARLFVVVRGGNHARTQSYVRDEFARRGARAEQVHVFPYRSTTDFLRFLGEIDVALDPFPYGGGTTTMQCLWMGVPVITLAGQCAFARNSIGPLLGAGLGDLIAESTHHYKNTALALGRDCQRLSRLRSTLRATVSASPLLDGASFARSVESAYVRMWEMHLQRE